MLEDVLLVVFCAVLALGGLAAIVWELLTGRLFDIDGLWLTLIVLTLTVVFGGNIAWSLYTGELQAIMRHWKEEARSEKRGAGSQESETASQKAEVRS